MEYFNVVSVLLGILCKENRPSFYLGCIWSWTYPKRIQKKSKLSGTQSVPPPPPFPPGMFRFVTLPLEIPEKISSHPCKFCKIWWHPLEIQDQKPRPMEIPHDEFARVFLEHPWKFHYFFNWPLEFPHVLSSLPLETPCLQSTVWILGVAQWSIYHITECKFLYFDVYCFIQLSNLTVFR